MDDRSDNFMFAAINAKLETTTPGSVTPPSLHDEGNQLGLDSSLEERLPVYQQSLSLVGMFEMAARVRNMVRFFGHGQWGAAQQTIVEVKAALHALESRLGQARRCQRHLQIRQQAAAVHNQANAAAAWEGIRGHLFARFVCLENRLVEVEDDLRFHTALCGPNQGLEAELGQLASDQRIAGALVTLKQETAAVDS